MDCYVCYHCQMNQKIFLDPATYLQNQILDLLLVCSLCTRKPKIRERKAKSISGQMRILLRTKLLEKITNQFKLCLLVCDIFYMKK